MKKCFMAKLLILFLLIILCTLVFLPNVQATYSSEEDSNFVAIEGIIDNEMLQKMNSSSNDMTTIMKYDSITGETTKVNMENIQRSRTGERKNYTESYNPNLLLDERLEMTPFASSHLVQILNTNSFPYRVTCRLTFDYGNSKGVASGFLVGPNLLLTSAHCVFDMNNGNAMFSNWVAYPGYNMGTYYGNAAGWSQVYFVDEWKETHLPQYDWCLCVLGDNLGSQVGWYGCQAYGVNSEMKNLEVRTIGYPEEKENGNRQCYARGNITKVYNEYFDSSVYVSSGMSGGPSVRISDNVAVGVNHGYYAEDRYTSVATRITQDVIDLINQLN